MIYEFKGISPKIDSSCFIAPDAVVIGDVSIGKNTSIWFQTIIRGDVHYIRIGENCNIQDMSLIHVSKGTHPVEIGNNVSLGHRVTIHGCTLKDNSFVGIGATVMDGAVVEEFGFVAAGALVTPGKTVPSGMMAMGAPAKIVREITEKEREMIIRTSKNYSGYKDFYLDSNTFKKL
ncbi:MAG: gamma carbonic anhydrase family protein [Leptospiraceae bacterium]|nr:gamma carbonic anhydrase family protein [Leptospiraceae bacterium]